MPTIKELSESRATSIAAARAIQDKADKDPAGKRALTADEGGQIDKHLNEAREFGRQAEEQSRDDKRRKDLADAERELNESRGRRTEPDDPQQRGQPGGGGGRDAGGEGRELRWRNPGGQHRHVRFDRARDTEEYNRDYDVYLRTGKATNLAQRAGEAPKREDRDLSADSFADGGALVAPTQMVGGLIKTMDDNVFIRQFATIHTVANAQNMGATSLDADPDEGEWTSEIGTGTDDNKMKFGKRELNPTPLAKRIKLSRKLVRMVPSVQALVAERLAYKFNVTQEKQFLLGDGSNKPLGLMVASPNGISTSRDISTGNTATELKADNLIACKFALKEAYRKRARWMFHTDGILRINLLKDGNGQYIWRQGLVGGEPDTLLGLPLHESPFMPNTFTTGKYVGLLGDFSFYWIAEALQLELQVLTELYAEKNQIGYLGRLELDAMPVLEEAFVRCKLG